MQPQLISVPAHYPLSSGYDAEWLLSLDMGPHPLWQLEEMWADLALSPGQRVLDLRAGRGATSVFLAREGGVRVDALDHWVCTDEVSQTLEVAGVSDAVHVLQGDVRTWDFQPDTYDAIVSVDAWEYFGTDVYFLHRLVQALKPGGTLAFSTPSLAADPYVVDPLPQLRDLAGYEVMAWHSAPWWRRHTEVTGGLVEVKAWVPDDSLELWCRWEDALGNEDRRLRDVLETYRQHSSGGPALGIVHVVARKPSRADSSPR